MDTRDPHERRSMLASRPNPGGRLDYVVTIEACLGGGLADVTLRYIPDRLLLDAVSFHTYLGVLAPAPDQGPEELAATILEDVNDQLIPRWIHVGLVASLGEAGSSGRIRADVEDRQPRWDNARLLARLERF